MTFAWPYLLTLLLVPVAVLVWDLTHRRRTAATSHPKILRAEAGTDSVTLASSAAPRAAFGSRPRYWLCAGLALAIVAVARPQWGRLEEATFDQSREILIAIDLSRSMLTPDVKPDRLTRAKLLITSLLEKLSGERVGLVVFSGTAFLQSPLSADYEILREFLPALGPDFLPEGGTNYHALLDASIQAFGATTAADRFLIILSDGEATDDNWRERLDELKKKNVRVIALGVGTAGGAMIPDATGGFIKDERGAVVLSKLESATLQELARATEGVYRDASAWLDLSALIKETVEAGQKGKFLEKNTIRLAERFQWPLAFALWCLLASLCYEFPVRPRPRTIALRRAADLPMASASASTTVAVLLVGLVALGLRPSASALDLAPPPATPSAELTKIIRRVATSENPTARDWSELAGETVRWGSQLQSAQQPIPEHPIRDGLAAVEAGRLLDPKSGEWSKLRDQLEALLQKSEEQKKQEEKDQQQKQDKDQKKDDQNNQDSGEKKPQDKDDAQKQQDSKDSKSDPSGKQDDKDAKSDQNKKSDESAFGDMKQKDTPPPPPSETETQKVGGQKDEKEMSIANADPSLTQPLQKLEQVRNLDSPARLFQLIEGPKKPGEKKPGKDW